MHLDSPHNLYIYSTTILSVGKDGDDQRLLLACAEGLFHTSAAKPAVPYRVAGVDVVYQLLLLADIETLVLVCGMHKGGCTRFISAQVSNNVSALCMSANCAVRLALAMPPST